MKAQIVETMTKAIIKNTMSKWVEPKDIKIPIHKLCRDLNCEYCQVWKHTQVQAWLASFEPHPPHQHLKHIVWLGLTM